MFFHCSHCELQTVWLMGAPAGLKLHAELATLLGQGLLFALSHLAPVYAMLSDALPMILGESLHHLSSPERHVFFFRVV
jgi:hypothetical protein